MKVVWKQHPDGNREYHFGSQYLYIRMALARVVPDMPINTITALTVRERQIASGILEGKTNKEIAAVHNLALRTVKFHIQKIYSKLGVHGRLKAFQKLLETGV